MKLARSHWSRTSTWRQLSIATSPRDETRSRRCCQSVNESHFRCAYNRNERRFQFIIKLAAIGRCNGVNQIQPFFFSDTWALLDCEKYDYVTSNQCSFKYHLKLHRRRDPRLCFLIYFFLITRHGILRTCFHFTGDSFFLSFLLSASKIANGRIWLQILEKVFYDKNFVLSLFYLLQCRMRFSIRLPLAEFAHCAIMKPNYLRFVSFKREIET